MYILHTKTAIYSSSKPPNVVVEIFGKHFIFNVNHISLISTATPTNLLFQLIFNIWLHLESKF